MINEAIRAISIALNREFGDGYGIHMEEVRQGLEAPCFFISCISPSSTLFLGERYFRENLFCLQYFPGQGWGGREECNAVAERLFQCLGCLEVGGIPVRGTGMKYEVVDGILHFFVNYNCFTCRAVGQAAMGGLESRTNVKGGG